MTKEEYAQHLKDMLRAVAETMEEESYSLSGSDPVAWMQLLFELTRELYQVTNEPE